jgi:hypothetical protein
MPMPPPKPVISRFKVTIAADVPLGLHDVRLVNKFGASNPRAFVVGDLAEVLEKEPNNDIEQAQRVELNSTINGNMAAPTDVDYYVFAGKKGQRVVFSCLGTSLDSRFFPSIEVYSAKHRQLASQRNYFQDDALTDCVLPEDGDYYIRLCQFTYTQGTAEHFYRLTITTAPWIDAIHPCVVEPGKKVQLTVYGRNLPGGQPDPQAVVEGCVLEKVSVTLDVPADPVALQRLSYSGLILPSMGGMDGLEYRMRNGVGASNPFLLTYARAPVVLDADASRTAATAQPITPPCEIAGRFDKLRERDWYTFAAKKGDVWNIEAFAERLGSPALVYFAVRNATANQDMGEGQDNPDTLAPKFFSRSEDPAVFRFTAPADGQYQLMVGNRLGDTLANPRQYYRVSITKDHPDFRLVVVPFANTRPDAAAVGQGGVQAFNVFAWRRAGFNGDIVLNMEGLPPGVTCAPQTMGVGVRQATLVVQAADTAAPAVAEVRIKGTATIAGQPVVREARPGSIVWPLVQPQAVSPTISRADRSLVLAVRDKTFAPYRLEPVLDKVILQQGDKANLTLKATRLWPTLKTPITAQVVDMPANLLVNNNQVATIPGDKNEVGVPVVVNAGAVPGVYNLVFRSTPGQVPYTRAPMDPKQPAKPTNVIQASAPVTLTVLPKTVAAVTLNSQALNAKIGMPVEVVVKVARQFDFAGEFKVQLVLPANMKGVSAPDVVIPAGKDEAKLVLNIPADAMPGPRAGLIVRTTALLAGNLPAVQDAPPLSVNVTK